jgi:hypothetical protein
MTRIALNRGIIIQAVGFPLLQHLNSGQKWVVVRVEDRRGRMAYVFRLLRGKKMVTHFASDVDSYIDLFSRGSGLNGFEIVGQVKPARQ